MKDLKLSFSIAKTHLLARLKQTMVATLGVTFGIGIFIYLVSFITGNNDFFVDITMSNSPHIHIFHEIKASEETILDKVYSGDQYMNHVAHVKPEQGNQNLKDGMQIVNILRDDPRVYAVSPSVTSQVFYRYGSANLNGNIVGVEINEEDKLFNISSKIIAGEMDKLFTTYNGVIMGSGLAKKLNVGLNDRINITTPEGKNLLLTIVALFKTGLIEIDNNRSYATLATVQKILGQSNSYITDINVRLHDLDMADQVARQYQQQFGYKAVDWMTANAAMMAGIQLNNIIVYGVVIAILLVAGFGIYNILTMMIYEKMKDIAILKAMGFSGLDVRKIFMVEALSIGLIGGLLGLVVGFLLAYAMSLIPYKNDIMIEMDHLPVSFKISYYIAGITFGLITTALAGFFPARRAARVDPIEILRG